LLSGKKIRTPNYSVDYIYTVVNLTIDLARWKKDDIHMALSEHAGLLSVSGARLHTEKTGNGPALVLIPGGGGDAAMYSPVAPLLAERSTVITLDRRGNSRSPLDNESIPVTAVEQAADVVAVLDHYAVDRAYVFGNSGSAIITLELLAKHEDRLLGAVVHEPPLTQLLPDSREQQDMDELRRIAETEGSLRGFIALAAITMPKPPRLFQTSSGRATIAAALRTVMAFSAVARWLTRRELLAVRVPWRLATGRDSVERPYYRPAHVLSDKLGVACVEFPGGHTAYQQQPEEFTSRLTEILDQLRQ
jgi:pimeloyl-ACP methyl ester carboxylesterase